MRAKITNLANGRTQTPSRDAGKNNYLLKLRYRYYNREWYKIIHRLDPQSDNSMKWNPVLDTNIYIFTEDMNICRFTDDKNWREIPLEESMHHSHMKPDRTYEWEYLGIKTNIKVDWVSGSFSFDGPKTLPIPKGYLTSGMTPFIAPETIDVEQGQSNKANKKSEYGEQ